MSEAINLREKFIKESEELKFIVKSMFDFSWLGDITTETNDVLIIAEGLFMYFKEQ